jgi:hypothetical protein
MEGVCHMHYATALVITDTIAAPNVRRRGHFKSPRRRAPMYGSIDGARGPVGGSRTYA